MGRNAIRKARGQLRAEYNHDDVGFTRDFPRKSYSKIFSIPSRPLPPRSKIKQDLKRILNERKEDESDIRLLRRGIPSDIRQYYLKKQKNNNFTIVAKPRLVKQIKKLKKDIEKFPDRELYNLYYGY